MGIVRLRGALRLIFAGGLAAALAGCIAGLRARPASEEDVAVYRALLAATPGQFVQPTTQPPLKSVGTIEERLAELAGGLPGLDTSTVRSLLARNRDSGPLPVLGDTTVVWIDADEWAALANHQEGWNQLLLRLPSARMVLRMSWPGYSRDGSQALVYVLMGCPGRRNRRIETGLCSCGG